jgi:hypothetical protein
VYHAIRTLAYQTDPEHGPWQQDLSILRMGEDLQHELMRRQEEASGDRSASPPTRRLHALLQAWAPGVLAIAPNAGSDGRPRHMNLCEPLPQAVLAPMIGNWSAAIVYQDEEVEVIDLEEELQAEDAAGTVLHSAWERERVDLTEAVVSPGGTAEPRHRLYTLLPEAVAFRLAATPYRTDGGSLRFRVVSSGDQGAKSVSLPPQRYECRGQTWYYSACLTNTVHAVPFASRFR